MSVFQNDLITKIDYELMDMFWDTQLQSWERRRGDITRLEVREKLLSNPLMNKM